jgi:hypothetical protein
LTCPEGASSLSIPDFKTIGTWSWQGFSPTHRPPLSPGNIPYSFLLEAESTPGS